MSYDVELPNGDIIEVPDNVSQLEAKQRIYKAYPQFAPKPVPQSTERTFGEAITDPLLGLVKGAGAMAQLPGQLYGLATGDFDTAAMRGPEQLQEYAKSLQSEGLHVREALRDKAMSEAEKRGIAAEFYTAITQTLKDPALISTFITEQVPEMLPMLLTGGISKLFTTGASQVAKLGAKEAAANAAKIATRTGIATGAVQQGADVGSDTYREALDLAKAQYPNKSPEEIQDIALSAARSAALEAGIVSLGAQNLPGAKAIERRMAGMPGEGRIRSAVGEAAGEMLEEGGGKFASNVNLQQIDPNKSLTAGVGSAAGLGAIGGGTLGAVIGHRAPDLELMPGQNYGESLADAAQRLKNEIDAEKLNLLPPPAPPPPPVSPILSEQDLNNLPYGQIPAYIGTLQALPQTPEIRAAIKAANTASLNDTEGVVNDFLLKKLDEASRSLQPQADGAGDLSFLPADLSTVISAQLANSIGFVQNKSKTNIFDQIVGKDISDPDQAAAVIDILNKYKAGVKPGATSQNIDTFIKSIPFFKPVTPATQGTVNVGTTDTAPSGEGTVVASEPGAGTAPAGVGTTEPSGVVSPGPDASIPVGGEAAAPPSVTPQIEKKSLKEPGYISGLNVRPPSDNINDVIDANFDSPIVVGNQTVNIDSINGGVRLSDSNEVTRVAELAKKISGPNGYISRIIVDGDNNVIEGQHRLEALRSLGVTEVPVYKIEEASDKLPVSNMKEAVASVGNIRSEQVNQIVNYAVNAIAENGIDGAGKLNMGAWQKHYDAAINVASIKESKRKKRKKAKPEEVATPEAELSEVEKQDLAAVEVYKAEAPARIAEKTEQFKGVLGKMLSRMGLKDVAVKIMDDVESKTAEGSYSAKLIKIALDAQNPVRVLNHEVIHALKELGFFTDSQWKVLTKQANESWVDTYLKNRGIDGNPLQQGEKSRYDAYMERDEFKSDPEAIVEEAIADAFGDFDVNGAPSGMLKAILNRLISLFDAIKSALKGNGFYTSEQAARQVFGKVARGELKAGETQVGEEKLSLAVPKPLADRGITQEHIDLYKDMRAKRDLVDGYAAYPTPSDKAAATRASTKFFNKIAPLGEQKFTLNHIANFIDLQKLPPDVIVPPADAEEVKLAKEYAKENGIAPYINEGLHDLPLDTSKDKTKFSIKTVDKFGFDPVNNIPLNKNGTVTLYYHTTKAKALAINKSKVIKSDGKPRIYLTNESNGGAVLTDRGNMDQDLDGSAVLVNVNPDLVQKDVDYETGRVDFFIPLTEGEFFAKKMQMASIQASRKKALTTNFSFGALEDRITNALTDYYKLSPQDKRVKLNEAKAVLKSQHNIGTLLSENGKLQKTRIGDYGLKYEGNSVASMGLGLAAAQKISEKISTCPNSAICEGLCLGETSGGNLLYGGAAEADVGGIEKSAFRAGPRMAQYLKTEAMIIHPEEFAILLDHEINLLEKWAAKPTETKKNPETGKRETIEKEIYTPAIRLNVTSDFKPSIWTALIEGHPDTEFYDYTKLNGNSIAQNHHLTYSSTGVSQVVNGEEIVNEHSNWASMKGRLDRGFNVAMAFTTRNVMPKALFDEESGKTYEVWDGDNYDARFLDPKSDTGQGMIVGLTNKDFNSNRTEALEKGAAKKTDGFFVDYDPKQGDTVTILDQSKFKQAIVQRKAEKRAEKEAPVAMPTSRKEKLSLRAPNTQWTDERIEYLLGKYAYFQDGREGDAKAYAILVKPKDFLDATSTKEYRKVLEAERKPLDVVDLEKYKQPIFLQVKQIKEGVFQITGHEGRHRMMALRDAGVDGGVPVLLEIRPFDVAIENAPYIEEPYFEPQIFTDGQAPKGFYSSDAIPISYKYKKALQNNFGGEADIKFSLRTAFGEAATIGPSMAGVQEGVLHLMPFKDNQIKSAIGNQGTYSEKRNIKLSLRDKLGLYSELENKIEAVGPNQAPAPQWKAMIKGMVQKGVKPEEIEWSGVNDYLDLQEGKVSKAALLEYLKEGGVKVEETTLNGKEVEPLDFEEVRDVPDGFEEYYEAKYERDYGQTDKIGIALADGGWWVYADGNEIKENLETREQAERVALAYVSFYRNKQKGEAKYNYGQLILPGGTNYREVLLTLPPKPIVMTEAEARKVLGTRPDVVLSEADIAYAANKDDNDYKSSHWDQLNVLAHIRINDRVDVDGKKVLFVEEVQSDWGQEGKREGFISDLTPITPTEWETVDRHDIYDTREEAEKDIATYPPAGDNINYYSPGEVEFRHHIRLLPGDKQNRYEIVEQVRTLATKTGRFPKAPFVTKTEGWLNLALKRIMVLAAEGNYDKVAFINGKQSAKRANLADYIDSIDYEKNDQGTYEFVATDKKGKTVYSKEEISLSEIEELVGKDIAKKIEAGEGDTSYNESSYNNWHTLSNVDLEVGGGKGMKVFYDQIVPIALKKLLPKVGGKELVTVDIKEPFTLRNVLHQPGFDVTPEMKQKVETTGLPKFSLRNTFSASVNAAVDRTTTVREDVTWGDRFAKWIAPENKSALRAALINRYNALGIYDRRRAEKMGGFGLLADASSESAALLSDLGSSLTAAILGPDGGAPVYSGGITTLSNFGGTVKGPLQIFAELERLGKGDTEIYRYYQFWAAVNMAKRVMPSHANPQGTDITFTPTDILRADEIFKEYPQFENIQKEWIKYNDKLAQYLVDTGVISQKNKDQWVKYGDYIPFYRQVDDTETVGPKLLQAIAGVKPPKKRKGGTEAPLADFLETIIRNTQSAVQMGIKNVAAQRAVLVAMDLNSSGQTDVIEPLNVVTNKPDTVTILVDGMQKSFRSADPLWLSAITSLNLPDVPFIGIFTHPANLLRAMVTKDPGFMLANMMRDSMQAMVASDYTTVNPATTLANFASALTGKSPEFKALMNAGLLGGHEYSKDIIHSGKAFARDLRKITGQKTTAETLLSPVTGLWDALEKGTTASDSATRQQIYKEVLERTKSPAYPNGNMAEAVYRAMEVMNFNRKGNSALIRILTATIPFFNARIQGLDVLYRAGMGIGTDRKTAAAIQKNFFIRGATMFALSCMYWSLTHDDDDYKKQEQETKDNYWLLPSLGVKIPIPFEVGIMFKVVPERIMAATFGTDTGADFAKSMKRQLVNTLDVNWFVPQAFKPLLETVTDHNFFTDRSIVGLGMDSIAEGYQVGPGTSKIAADIGKAAGYSPMKIDHLISGYTGTMGMYAFGLFDAIFKMNDDNTYASKRFEQTPVLKRFLIDPLARGPVTAYYETKNEADSVVRTAALMERTMNYKEWGPYYKENIKVIATHEYLLDLEKTMKEFREMRMMVRASKAEPDQKRDTLANITRAENQLNINIQTIKKNMQ